MSRPAEGESPSSAKRRNKNESLGPSPKKNKKTPGPSPKKNMKNESPGPNNRIRSSETISKRELFKGGNRQHPVVILWDLENLGIPKGKSAGHLVKRLRDRFMPKTDETIWDAGIYGATKIPSDNVPEIVLDSLWANDVEVVWAPKGKSTADMILLNKMKVFADLTTEGSLKIVLLTNDQDFFEGITSMVERGLHITLVCKEQSPAKWTRSSSATVKFSYEVLTADLPQRATAAEEAMDEPAAQVGAGPEGGEGQA